MKKLWLTLFALGCLTTLHAKSPAMKEAKKEAEKTAKDAISPVAEKLLNKKNLDFTEQDILPDVDKGKKFDADSADKNFNHPSQFAETCEAKKFLNGTRKSEKLEENEKFLAEGHRILQNPLPSLDITTLETEVVQEEEKLETCQESGTYQVVFTQTLTVQATPEVKETIHHCKGHHKTKTYNTVEKAQHKKSKKEESFKKKPDLASYKVKRDANTVTSSWIHKDNAGSCKKFNTEEKTSQEAQEIDTWNTDNAEGLLSIETNPFCKLLYTKFPGASETRVINGKAVTRDAWSRQLYFSCEPSAESKCAKLRTQGGILLSKKCLLINELEECDLWEKTYDIGKLGASQNTKASFQKDELWGLTDEFDSSYEKNTDFGSTLTTLSIFSDLENTLENQGSAFHDKIKLFKGESMKCQKSFLSGNVFDCCKEMDGVALSVKLANCSTEEKCLAENKKRGKCHFIGTQSAKLGTVTEHIYCCFPTKLARVVHEQGRKQLGIKWGSAEKPKCRGFRLRELQQLNFSKMDLSEVIDDIKIDKQAYANKLKGSIDSLRTKVQAEIEKKRLELNDESNVSEDTHDKIEGKNA
jgi:conjugal transfer mating pair stabilization protein TraN